MLRIDELHLEHPFMGARMIRRANQIWALDTTYIPMPRGFVYLTAMVDEVSRMVPAHKVAITLKACHAKEIIDQAFAR
jgi:putative transposase